MLCLELLKLKLSQGIPDLKFIWCSSQMLWLMLTLSIKHAWSGILNMRLRRLRFVFRIKLGDNLAFIDAFWRISHSHLKLLLFQRLQHKVVKLFLFNPICKVYFLLTKFFGIFFDIILYDFLFQFLFLFSCLIFFLEFYNL